MALKRWQFLTLLLTALDMGLAFSHLLQMPPRMTYDSRLWRMSQSIYYLYGPPIGAWIDIGATIAPVVLAVLVRGRGAATFRWAVFGAGCFVLAHTLWWIYVAPVNAVMEHWTPDTMPADWEHYRKRWEYAHSVRAVIQIVGFGALLASLLAAHPIETDSPANRPR